MKFKHLCIVVFLLLVYCVSFARDNNQNPIDIPPDTEIPVYIDELGNSCWKLRDRYSDSALQLGLQALHLAEKYQYPTKHAKISNFVGVVYLHYLYNYREAIPYFQNAMKISILMKDSIQIGYAYNNLGDVFLLNGNLPLALKYAELSYDIFNGLKMEDGIAFSLINLAEVHRAKKNYDLSLEYFNQAVEIRKSINSANRMGFVAFNRARTLEESGDLNSAEKFYQQSLEYSYESDDFRYVSWSLNGLANIYYKLADYPQALNYYSKALQWNKDRHHEFAYLDNYIGIALVSAHLGHKEKGLEFLDKSIEMAKKLGINTQIIDSYNAVIEFYKILGEYRNIKESFDNFLNQYDSILSAQQFEIVNELEHNFTIQQELFKSEQQHEYDKKQRNALILVIIIMVLIIFVVFYQYRINKKMNLKLEEMNQTKDKLFSVISHDLKNPFNTLIGFSDILVTSIEDKEYEEAHTHASLINKASHEGYKQLTTLLNWSLSQSGKIEFRPELVDLSKLLHEIEEAYLPEIQNHKVQLELKNTIKEEITLDPNIIKIILENVLSNAFKYTPEGGQIAILCSMDETHIKIAVSDTGIGMDSETLEALDSKERFVKSRKGLRKEKGTGLGLSIINDLIEIHHGKLNIESKDGSGTTFKVEFPRL